MTEGIGWGGMMARLEEILQIGVEKTRTHKNK